MFPLLVILLFITQVSSDDPDNSLCRKPPTVDIIGVPLPELPNQFQAIFEANILQKSYTVYQEEYYDFLGNRGVIITTRNGRSTKMITDFATYSVHQVDLSTGRCVVEDLRKMQSTLFNFTTTATGGHVKGLADIFKFSSKFNETYLGTTQVRGIPAHHWTTCLHVEDLKATFNMDYYFSVKTHDIVGSQSEIPLRAKLTGIASNVDQSGTVLSGTHNFSHVYDFIAFQPGPIKDPSVFQIPPGVICTGQKNHKPIPKIADQVSFGMEKINIGPDKTQTDPIYIQVDYDFTSKLARLDLSQLPSSDFRKMFNDDRISLIQDFNLGVQYVIDAVYGNCTVTELTASFDDFTPRPSYLLPPEMRHPIVLLDINYTKLVYQGQKVYRGFSVESWGRIDNVTNFIHEIFFLKNETSLHPPSYMRGTTVPRPCLVGLYTSVKDQQHSKVETYTNIYDYQPNRIDPSRFDIRQCYSHDSHDASFKQLHIAIKTDNPKALLSRKSEYLNHIHQFLSQTAKVQPTRISDLYISDGLIDNTVSVYFMLLDKSPMPAGRWSNIGNSPSLQEAYSNLETAVQKGTSIELDSQSLPILTTSLYTQKSVETEDKQGYSSGSMAGLGVGMLITGIVCGIVGTYVVNRRRDSSIPYELQEGR